MARVFGVYMMVARYILLLFEVSFPGERTGLFLFGNRFMKGV